MKNKLMTSVNMAPKIEMYAPNFVRSVILIPNESYWEAMSVVPILLLAYFFLGIYHNLSVWYKITDRTKFGAYISIFGAILTLVINLFFIPKFGYMASATATLAAYAAMAFISYKLGQKYYRVPYNLKKIGLYLMLSIGFSILSFYVFRAQDIVGGTLILILTAIVWAMEKTEIKQLIKS
jgi:O-antigen/teichoic acid export membrane protein